MESSTVLAFRIFVMLSCLIIVPMAAIFGSAFPDVVKSVLVDRIVAWSTGQPPGNAAAASPGGFREVTARGGESAPDPAALAPRWNGPQAEPAGWQQPSVAPSNVALAANHVGEPAGGILPAAAGVSNSPFQPAVSNAPAAAGQPAPHAGSAGGQPDRFSEIERRLREQGATYYLLETWGNNGELYRFHCRMAVGSDPNYTRHFEATHREALDAMSDVLARVEAWRAGRLQ